MRVFEITASAAGVALLFTACASTPPTAAPAQPTATNDLAQSLAEADPLGLRQGATRVCLDGVCNPPLPTTALLQAANYLAASGLCIWQQREVIADHIEAAGSVDVDEFMDHLSDCPELDWGRLARDAQINAEMGLGMALYLFGQELQQDARGVDTVTGRTEARAVVALFANAFYRQAAWMRDAPTPPAVEWDQPNPWAR